MLVLSPGRVTALFPQTVALNWLHPPAFGERASRVPRDVPWLRDLGRGSMSSAAGERWRETAGCDPRGLPPPCRRRRPMRALRRTSSL